MVPVGTGGGGVRFSGAVCFLHGAGNLNITSCSFFSFKKKKALSVINMHKAKTKTRTIKKTVMTISESDISLQGRHLSE